MSYRGPGMPRYRWDYLGNIWGAAFRHYTHFGFFHLYRQEVYSDYATDMGHRGYFPVAADFREKMKEDPAIRKQFINAVASMSKSPTLPNLVSDDQVERVLALAAFIQKKGAEAILLRAPITAGWDLDGDLIRKIRERCPDGLPILDYGDPKAYPALWKPANRRDGDHFNTRGAALWTRMIAERIADMEADGTFKTARWTSCPSKEPVQ
jgi:hypothetical protein